MADDFMAAVAKLNTVALEFEASGPKLAAKVDTIVRSTAHLIEANAKQIVPVDTGNLRNSIGTDITRHAEGQGYGTEAEIGAAAAYAPYVELGTTRMAPRAFLGPSLDRYSPDFVAALDEAMAVDGF